MDPNDQLLKGDGPCSVRLHVGGLGPSVISSDLVQTFSSLGKVSSVDFVRTKGRNFAYITLEAASPQDIKRLFSLYNGCMWKGGRLKLEKAKEFYLDKLHHEWAERDCLQEQSETKTSKSECTSRMKSIPVPESSTGFSIYFPRLRKVKKIPEKGQGKHKRSFERVDALPCSLLQLCNCNHCMTTSNQGNMTREQAVTIDEKQEQNLKYSSTRSVKDTHRMEKSDVKQLVQATGVVTQENAQETGDVQRKRAKFDLESNITFLSGENKEIVKSEKLKDQTEHVDATSELQELNKSIGTNWVQKASWKSLVGETGRISFSLGSMLGQNLGLLPSSSVKTTADVSSSFMQPPRDTKLNNVVSSWIDGSSSVPSIHLSGSSTHQSKVSHAMNTSKSIKKADVQNDSGSINHQSTVSVEYPMVQGSPEGVRQTFQSSRLNNRQSHDLTQVVQQKHLSLPSLGNRDDKVCMFMKSDKSEQEWLESKRAVKEIVKRCRKDALRSMKMFHTKQKY